MGPFTSAWEQLLSVRIYIAALYAFSGSCIGLALGLMFHCVRLFRRELLEEQALLAEPGEEKTDG